MKDPMGLLSRIDSASERESSGWYQCSSMDESADGVEDAVDEEADERVDIDEELEPVGWKDDEFGVVGRRG